MRITDLLDVKSISLDLAPGSKSEALDMAIDLMVKSGKINDREAYKKQVYLREEDKCMLESCFPGRFFVLLCLSPMNIFLTVQNWSSFPVPNSQTSAIR